MTNQYFATVARGLEEIAAKELENLGAKNVNPDFTGVYFEGDKALLYKVNIWPNFVNISPFAPRNNSLLKGLYMQKNYIKM